jgi:endonuclease G
MATATDPRPTARRRLSPDLKKALSEVRHKCPRDLEPPENVERRRRNLMAHGRTAGQAQAELERILNNNDLVEVAYLEQGLRAARAVGRVQIRDEAGRLIGYGSGFLVSPRLLLTNNHVLGDATTAASSLVEFDYERDLRGMDRPTHVFALKPGDFFATSPADELDFTLVAVAPTAEDQALLADFGWLPLLATPQKALRAEYLTIIQHPRGERKQVCLRDNKLLRYQDNTLWYATDTEPGSSGSPVFNDSWEVVGLHHTSVPERDADNNVVRWIANEGIRISRIVEEVKQAHADHPLVRPVLRADEALPAATTPTRTVIPSSMPVAADDPHRQAFTLSVPLRVVVTLDPGGLVTTTSVGAVTSVGDQEKVSIDPNYPGRQGYDADFLGAGEHSVAMPRLTASLLDDVAPLLQPQDDNRHVLHYHHFSVIMNRRRRLAFFTAVNIDGARHANVKRERDAWFFDPRIDRAAQAGEEVYRANALDRGHLVRRLDPAWGPSVKVAKVANDDTFHFTNCSPQHADFNQNDTTWAGLEDYILHHARNLDLRVTVFTGPVLSEHDEPHRGILLPREFWKVVAMVKDDGHLSVTAYLLSQASLLRDVLDEEEFSYGDYNNFQVPLARIEEKTGLRFGNLHSFDPLANLESDAAVTLTDLKRIRL